MPTRRGKPRPTPIPTARRSSWDARTSQRSGPCWGRTATGSSGSRTGPAYCATTPERRTATTTRTRGGSRSAASTRRRRRLALAGQVPDDRVGEQAAPPGEHHPPRAQGLRLGQPVRDGGLRGIASGRAELGDGTSPREAGEQEDPFEAPLA